MKYTWTPINPLSPQEKAIDLSKITSLHVAWLQIKDRVHESSENNLRLFNERLARSWSIETGILERIYDVDRGTTQVLIERGFYADYIERSKTTPNPEYVIEVLRDHQAAIDLVHDCISSSRPLTIGFIHELHAILTRHQQTVEGVDQFGNAISLPLLRGAFKKLPNNPKRSDGSIHEYCPPEHVQSEMENLLQWYQEDQSSNPILKAAWFHHRFTQIHPYQDGNGRIVRALVNLILIKAGLFPIVITRDQRSEYIASSELADRGDLIQLVQLFTDIEQRTILQALSLVPDEKPAPTVVEHVVESIATKLKRRREETAQRLRKVNDIAAALQADVANHLKEILDNLQVRINSHGALEIKSHVILGGPNFTYHEKPTQHWYQYQIATRAQEVDQRVNFEEDHYFVRARLSSDRVPWLTYVVSLHHIGKELTGIMEVTAFAEISFSKSEDDSPGITPVPCMVRPFTITINDDADTLKSSFLDWVSETFAIAVKQWGEVL